MDKITHAEVRMYRMGTGDCFIIKMFKGTDNTFTMMIDCGTWKGSKEHLEPYIKNLKDYIREGRTAEPATIDLLVVTHEHLDHVSVFKSCKELFTADFVVKKIWMGWTENDAPTSADDPLGDQLKHWKEEYGQRKKALNVVADRLNSLMTDEKAAKKKSPLGLQPDFAVAVDRFAELHFSARGSEYIGGLAGMEVVKKEIATNNIAYVHPGQVISNPEGAEGIKFYVLGPPTSIDSIKAEGAPADEPGETFSHSQNNKRTDNDSFATAILNLTDPQLLSSILPFDESFLADETMSEYASESWRKIDYDWLNSAGSLALRMNSATNNLSVALAIEFADSGRVMLFPGDAEYGSWKSWHSIKWQAKDRFNDNKPLETKGLLNRTVFYKVAHHLSHNGSAKRLGVEMMTDPDLVAMATLDYDVISPGWTSTMPNRDLIADLLLRTKGRLIIMNEEGLSIDRTPEKQPLKDKILATRQQFMTSAESTAFHNAFSEGPGEEKLYYQYKVNAM
ncbi:hypothetical protein GCM10007423_29100 [Dyadobacter endophyticus]|uniref:Metallo-beta-lactamase domain-containing protein n=1 Tax=Dyadobacter endophyticus TaxID=1749036 RepID=A0ABQ1YT42_9BACT|nr:MBL fold metallo-hydrolase [Dyadobacter endophyticus]GGH36667.1 hypothetical protein GCM10007423_29100 [Dyadobacter endophyticus]